MRVALLFIPDRRLQTAVALFCSMIGGEGKGEKIRAILEGISDGLGGRLGNNPRYDPEIEQEVPGPKIA